MDDGELPAGQPQIEPQDGGPPGGSVGSLGSHLPSASDENENQLDGCGQHGLTGSAGAMGRPAEAEQDSLNNNAGCTPPWEAAEGEASEHAAWGGPGGGQDLSGKDTTAPGNGSSRTTGPARTTPPGIFFNSCSCSSWEMHLLPVPPCAWALHLPFHLSVQSGARSRRTHSSSCVVCGPVLCLRSVPMCACTIIYFTLSFFF